MMLSELIDSTALKWLSFALTSLGALGGIILSQEWMMNRFLVRYFLDFRGDDVVLILASESRMRHTLVTTEEVTTGLGQVRGTAAVMEAIGRIYGRRRTAAQFSTLMPHRAHSDMILLGGPKKNLHSLAYLSEFGKAYPKLGLVVDDEGFDESRARIELCGEIFAFEQDGPLSRDFAVVAFWKNPFLDRRSRGILCCGLTSFGTEAAAEWAFREAIFFRDNTIFDEDGPPRLARPFWSFLYKRKLDDHRNILILLEITIFNKSIRGIKVVRRKPLGMNLSDS